MRLSCFMNMARTYLQMMDYDKAPENANKALAINDKLVDWVLFYQDN